MQRAYEHCCNGLFRLCRSRSVVFSRLCAAVGIGFQFYAVRQSMHCATVRLKCEMRWQRIKIVMRFAFFESKTTNLYYDCIRTQGCANETFEFDFPQLSAQINWHRLLLQNLGIIKYGPIKNRSTLGEKIKIFIWLVNSSQHIEHRLEINSRANQQPNLKCHIACDTLLNIW